MTIKGRSILIMAGAVSAMMLGLESPSMRDTPLERKKPLRPPADKPAAPVPQDPVRSRQVRRRDDRKAAERAQARSRWRK